MKWNAPPPVALGVRRKAQLPISTWVVQRRISLAASVGPRPHRSPPLGPYRLGGWSRVLGAAEEPDRSVTQEATVGVRSLWHHQHLTHFNELLDGCSVWSIGVANMGVAGDRGR